jgi:tetratricopeptide (TPR) repeat protein
VRRLDPEDEEVLTALATLHGASGDVDGQLEALRALAARTEDPALLRPRLLALATLQEERKRDLAGALHTLRRLLDAFPDDREALMRLDVLCVRQERWIELSEILAKEAELAGAGGDIRARLGFLFRLGQLRESHLLDREGALALYEEVLGIDPGHTAARLRVEAQLEAAPTDLEIIGILEKVSRANEDWHRTADLIELRAAAALDPDERKQALDELAELQASRLRRIDLSFITLARAFREDPTDRALWSRLFAAAEASESTEEWLALLEEEHVRLEPEALEPLAGQVGQICERALRDEAAALRWYERARRLGSRDAALALERLHRAAERWEPLAEILDGLAEAEPDPAEKVALLFRFGRLAEDKLESPQRAAMAFERILLIEPDNLPALRALEPIYEARRDHAQLYRNLAAQAQATAEGGARTRLVARLAEVATARGDVETAIEHWRDLLEKNPRHPGATEALDSLLEGQGSWSELADLLQARLASSLDPRELVALGLRLGRLQVEQLDRFDDGAQSYRSVLDRDPRNREALESLARLHRLRQEHEPLVGMHPPRG